MTKRKKDTEQTAEWVEAWLVRNGWTKVLDADQIADTTIKLFVLGNFTSFIQCTAKGNWRTRTKRHRGQRLKWTSLRGAHRSTYMWAWDDISMSFEQARYEITTFLATKAGVFAPPPADFMLEYQEKGTATVETTKELLKRVQGDK